MRPLEAARELAHGHLLHVALVGLALLGLEDAAHIGDERLRLANMGMFAFTQASSMTGTTSC